MPNLANSLSLALAAMCFSAFPAFACPVGKPVEIEWNGSQFSGSVLDGPDAQGNCLVSYDGYDESWNEWAAIGRIPNLDAAPAIGVSCPVGASRQIEWNGSQWDGTILEGPNAIGECYVGYDGWDASWNEWVAQSRISGAVPPAGVTCPIGAALEIEWNGTWWDGSVLEGPDGQGHCLVTYEGWDASWNEWVAQDRLRNAQ